MIPFGKAKKIREGKDMTIITYGALVQRSLVAAKQAEQEGTSVEIIDLRSLVPYDWDAIAESVKRTNRVIVAHEDSLSFGYGAEIAARIADRTVRVSRCSSETRLRSRHLCGVRAATRRRNPPATC